MAQSKKRPLAVFRISTLRRLGDFIAKSQTIVADIGDNSTLFATPSPTLASVTGHINALVAAQTQVGQRVPGSVAVRNAAYSTVLDAMYALMRYVQGLADSAADTETAIILITSSGFDLKVNGVFEKPPLAVKPGISTGIVRLIAKSAGTRASYNWQQSANNAASWIDLPTTLQAKTQVTGLTSKSYYVFRVRFITKDGPGNWSTPVGIVIQ